MGNDALADLSHFRSSAWEWGVRYEQEWNTRLAAHSALFYVIMSVIIWDFLVQIWHWTSLLQVQGQLKWFEFYFIFPISQRGAVLQHGCIDDLDNRGQVLTYRNDSRDHLPTVWQILSSYQRGYLSPCTRPVSMPQWSATLDWLTSVFQAPMLS